MNSMRKTPGNSFTDDSLKRLKNEIERGFYGSNRDRLNALLARLEAAEKCIIVTYSNEDMTELSDDYKSWLKSKGART